MTAYDLYRGTDIDSMEYFKRIDVIKNSYQDREIRIGETYYYYVTATNVVGESMPSEIVSATYNTAPTSPMNLTCISGNGFIHLSWLAPENDGGSPVLKYQIHRGSVLVESEIVAEPDAEVLEYNDTSVTNGITYTYNVTSVSDVGTSRPSNQISATPMTFPQPPANFTVEPGNGYVNISWEQPLDNGGSRIQYYYLYRSGGGVDDMKKEIPAGGDLTYQDRDVLNGELYNYSISALNMVGVSDIIGPLQAMPKGISSSPTMITVWYGSGFVHIFWEPPLSDAGSSIIGYVVYRDNVHISDIGPNVLEFNDTSVENGMTYSYYVTALNSIGESVKSDSVWGYPFKLPVQTDPPTPPRNLTLEKDENNITLSWNVPEDDGGMDITGYRIYRSLREDGQFESVDWVSSSELSWTDEDVVLDREYFYYVTAFNEVHESVPSSKVSGKLEGIAGDDDEEIKEVNWLLIVIPIVLILLILLVIGMFLIYRRGRREDEDEMSSQDAEYEPPSYDFNTIQKSPSVDHPDDDEKWE
ncbi:MAG: fibronectin type III domain-containing protein [Candidatus Thermoplasmatota archaeon]|nr:fibronectin type III domain-containing protein [Candidatus Thermoplasmatota archaeon]